MGFFDKNLLLYSTEAERIYDRIKDLPIIDYHCHLSGKEITDEERFSDSCE